MADAEFGEQVAVGMDFVGGAVVGYDALGGDAEAGEPGQRAADEGECGFLALIGQDLGVGQARGVIGGDMQVFSAGAAFAALTLAVAGDAMADAVDAAELLDVEMDQFAGVVALIADRVGLGLECAEPRPRRRRMAPAVERGRPSCGAICDYFLIPPQRVVELDTKMEM